MTGLAEKYDLGIADPAEQGVESGGLDIVELLAASAICCERPLARGAGFAVPACERCQLTRSQPSSPISGTNRTSAISSR